MASPSSDPQAQFVKESTEVFVFEKTLLADHPLELDVVDHAHIGVPVVVFARADVGLAATDVGDHFTTVFTSRLQFLAADHTVGFASHNRVSHFHNLQ
tara:strand:+ start:2726 stop:3019 length:294 start_codon:yes stop_codon:yes gene_type:complete